MGHGDPDVRAAVVAENERSLSGDRAPAHRYTLADYGLSEERIAELARMLAGLGDSDTGRAHAEELLEAADSDKVAQSGAHASR